jgi:hypothetical protein
MNSETMNSIPEKQAHTKNIKHNLINLKTSLKLTNALNQATVVEYNNTL